MGSEPGWGFTGGSLELGTGCLPAQPQWNGVFFKHDQVVMVQKDEDADPDPTSRW